MPQFDFEMPTLLLGQIGDSTPVTIDSFLNELLPQLSTISLAGGPTHTGTFTVQIEGSGGQLFTGTFVASSTTTTVLIDGLIADLLLTMLNEATFVNASPDLEITFLQAGIVYTITFPSNPSGEMSVANTQDAGGTDVGLGLALAQSSNGDLIARLPTADTDVLLGISVRNVDIQTNVGGSGETETEPGDSFSLMRGGSAVVRATTAVSAGDPVFVRHAAATAAEPLGSMSATDDGNTVALPGARWRSSTTAAAFARVVINNP